MSNKERVSRTRYAGTVISFREVPAFEPLGTPSHGRRRPAEHIPRPPNAFVIFRSDFCKRSTDGHQQNKSKEAAALWKALDDTARAEYYERADKAKADHEARYPDYVYRPSKPGEGRRNRRTRREYGDMVSSPSDASSSSASSTTASSPGAFPFSNVSSPETKPDLALFDAPVPALDLSGAPAADLLDDRIVQLLQQIVPPSKQELAGPTLCADYTTPPPRDGNTGFSPRWANHPEDFIGVNPRMFDPNHDGPFFAPKFTSAVKSSQSSQRVAGFDYDAWMAEP